MTIRRAASGDLGALMALEAVCFEGPGQWSQQSWQAELDGGDDRAVWVVESTRWAHDDGCQAFGELVSAACFRLVGPEAELFRVMTAPPARGLGLATLVLSAGLAWARQAGATVMRLEVRHDNLSARSLYADLGFTDAYLRTNYYAFGQDAVVMSRELLEGAAPSDMAVVEMPDEGTEPLPGLWADLHGEAEEDDR